MNANIVVMGKTGSGKSTLVNAVMGADVAPSGVGQSITKKNEIYSRTMLLNPDRGNNVRRIRSTIHLHDTVGLELDGLTTTKTLREIRGYIEKVQNKEENRDINLVWFCVNNWSNRFESYEVELIAELANKYEIPFIIVITQCFDSEKGDLEKQIECDLPEVSTMRVLAKEYKTVRGIVPAFGIEELLHHSVFSYDKLKVKILESKLVHLLHQRTDRIDLQKKEAERCIREHAQSAKKIGLFPIASIPFVHGICIKMLYDLKKIFGIQTRKGLEADILANIVVGIIVTPTMCIPILSTISAHEYVLAAGFAYCDALVSVIEKSTDSELINIELVSARIKEELRKRHGGKN